MAKCPTFRYRCSTWRVSIPCHQQPSCRVFYVLPCSTWNGFVFDFVVVAAVVAAADVIWQDDFAIPMHAVLDNLTALSYTPSAAPHFRPRPATFSFSLFPRSKTTETHCRLLTPRSFKLCIFKSRQFRLSSAPSTVYWNQEGKKGRQTNTHTHTRTHTHTYNQK